MLFRESIDSWLAGLDAPAGTNLALNEAGAVGIALGSGLVLTIEVEDGTGMLHLHCGLRRMPTDDSRASMLEEALALNLFNRGTEGATLGLDRQSDTLILSISRDIASLTQEEFAGLLVVFAETADALLAKFAGLAAPAAAEAPAPAVAPSAQPFFADHADPRFLA
jgi:hypothetical protein